MKRIYTFLLIIAVACLVSCNSGSHHGNRVEILRFEQVLFDTPGEQLPAQLRQFASQYQSTLLPIYPDDEFYITQLKAFVADSTVRDIYNITNSTYGDLTWLEKELSDALDKAAKADEDIHFEHFATFVSGISDFDNRIAVDRQNGSIRISIDHYALGGMEKYSYFGLPLYIVERCDSVHLASDIMAAIAREYIFMPDDKDVTMLDIMISEGKVLYFLDQVMPRKEEHIKIRYSKEQMEWMRRNENNVWSYFIQNNLLYEKDFNRYHNFVDEAPKTNAFKDSAPRTTDYIGWQIVKKYMEGNRSSMKELFENTNSQQILQQSGYKP